jgi:Ca-activated chloride channel homolog
MRAVGISLLAAAVALTVAGCAGSQPSSAPPASAQVAANPSHRPVAGLCKSPDAPPADVAHRPGYQQFDVSVTDASGQPISGLRQQDFVISVGTQSLPVAYFRENKNDEPVAIALVVDTSGSMVPKKLPIVKQSLGKFVTNLNQCDEVALFTFSRRVDLLMPFSTDHRMVVDRMDLFHGYGPTAIYDATDAALEELAHADYPNRVILLVTDGIDNYSIATREQVVAQATKDGVPIYAVGIGDPDSTYHTGPFERLVYSDQDDERVDAKALQAFSAASGGRSFIVPATLDGGGKDFQNAIAAIGSAIGSGYAIGAVLPAGATLPTVKVAIANRPDLVVRARPIAASP